MGICKNSFCVKSIIPFKRGDAVPKFHYEIRSFSKVVLCSDLTDNELEFMVVQGINLNVAKDAHTYCRYVLTRVA